MEKSHQDKIDLALVLIRENDYASMARQDFSDEDWKIIAFRLVTVNRYGQNVFNQSELDAKEALIRSKTIMAMMKLKPQI